MMQCSAVLAFSIAAALAGAGAGKPVGTGGEHRALLSWPEEDPTRDAHARPMEEHARGILLGEPERVERALASEAWPRHVRAWLRGRWLLRSGREDEAALLFEEAAIAWPDSGTEPRLVGALFDRQRLTLALDRGDSVQAGRAVQKPVVRHDRDPRWALLVALARGAAGQLSADELAAVSDSVWAEAPPELRQDPVFARRPLAHLAAGDSALAGAAWLQWARGLRRPARVRYALQLWDARPALRVCVQREGLWLTTARWLARVMRRPEGLEVARRGVGQTTGRERARLHVEVAEQLYRLRRHHELESWLAEAVPESLTENERATLAAYPWGALRREGPSVEAAEGFENLARQFSDTERGEEAWWEAGWMWELSNRWDDALRCYERYVTDAASGPYVEDAALRIVLLHHLEGRHRHTLQSAARLRPLADGDWSEVAIDWLSARSRAAIGESLLADSVLVILATEHPTSPFSWEPGAVDRAETGPRGSGSWSMSLRELEQAQRTAFRRIGDHLGVGDPTGLRHPRLLGIERLLELGIVDEGEVELAALPRESANDPGLLLVAVALSWRMGVPESQARLAWWLEGRVASEDPKVGQALQTIARPTPYAIDVLSYAAQSQVSPALIWALMRRESFYDADVVSLAGAHGLVQLMPSTAARLAEARGQAAPSNDQLFRPATNLQLGVHYLEELFDRYERDPYRTLAAYNAGEINAERWWQRFDPSMPPQMYILLISYTETRSYLYNVLKHWAEYQQAYPSLAVRR